MITELTGEVRVDLPLDQAWVLFTPEGERSWVEGWDPHYPGGVVSEQPGAVFLTGPIVWVVVDFDPGRLVRYARTTPGDRAGLVTVTFRAEAEATTVATVTYALAALSASAARDLETFAAGYDEFLASWERMIAASLGG